MLVGVLLMSIPENKKELSQQQEVCVYTGEVERIG